MRSMTPLRPLLLISSLALALTAAAESEIEIEANDEEQSDTITVTAERGRERIALDTPQAVSTISRLSLDEQVPIDLAQALQRLPSVGLGPAGETLSFWQQGFSIRGLGSQRVLTLTDGVRLSGQGTGYGGGNISIYDTFSVERIELLRGPNSVLYGTDAFGGVLNVITRQPRQRSEFGVNGGVGFAYDAAFNLKRSSFFMDVGNERVSSVFGASVSSNDNPKLADGTQATSGATDKSSAFARVNIEIDGQRQLSLFGNLSRDEDVEIEDSAIPFGPVGQGPLRFTFPLYQRALLGADYIARTGDARNTEYRLGVHYQGIRREFDRTAPEVGFLPPPGRVRVESVRVITDDKIDTFEISPQVRFDLGDHNIIVGVDVGHDRSTGPETETREQLFPFGPPSPLLRPGPTELLRVDAKQFRAGAYLQDNWRVAPQWELIAGARVDYFDLDDKISGDSDSDTGLSGNLAAVFYRNESHRLYANVGAGFRAPDLAERYQRAVVSVVEPVEIIGNPDLDSERSRSLDLGSKWENQRFSGEVAVFYNRINNYIVEQVVQTRPTIEQPVNVDDVTLYGWELSGAWRHGDWELFANGSRTYAPSDRAVLRLDGGRFNYGVAYRFAGPWASNGRIELQGRTVASSRDLTELGREDGVADRVDYPGFSVFELRARLDVPMGDRRLRVVGGVRNLTDKAYVEPFFNRVQPERSLYASVQYLF